jgi:hypothetical protein
MFFFGPFFPALAAKGLPTKNYSAGVDQVHR